MTVQRLRLYCLATQDLGYVQISLGNTAIAVGACGQQTGCQCPATRSRALRQGSHCTGMSLWALADLCFHQAGSLVAKHKHMRMHAHADCATRRPAWECLPGAYLTAGLDIFRRGRALYNGFTCLHAADGDLAAPSVPSMQATDCEINDC